MTNRISRTAAAAGTVLMTAMLLTGCAGEKHTFAGKEVSDLGKTIEGLDASWKQHVTDGVKATVGDDSRCYIQRSTDGIIAEVALCGPVHYLGKDETTFDAVNLVPAPVDSDKVSLAGGSGFNSGKPNGNTTLYRTDGKKAPENSDLAEPEAEQAKSATAIWRGNSVRGDSVIVKTPEGSLTVAGSKISDRIGGSSDRLQAGEGHKFGTVGLNIASDFGKEEASTTYGVPSTRIVKTELAFVSGGKTYPIGKAKSGDVSMAVPGDGNDLALAVTYEGLTQTVTLADQKLHTTATALYDNVPPSFNANSASEAKTFGKSGADGFFAQISPGAVKATRSAYDAKAGWAKEGKAWIAVETPVQSTDPRWVGNGVSSSYDAKLRVTAAKLTNVSGEAFSLEPTSITDQSSGSWYTVSGSSILLFEVPADVREFKVSYTVNLSGPKSKSQRPEAPASATFDYEVPATEVTFIK
jgi:hypothetical protein